MDPRIREKFRRIDVPLRLAESPREFSRALADRTADSAFMIDIRTRRGRSRPIEYVLMHCGRDADVRVLDVDRRHRQVLLDVREGASRLKTLRRERLRKRMVLVEYEIAIEAARRRMLVGMDESHLFVCPLRERASSVAEAHRKLAPGAVHRARRSLKVKRQGEWFFVPVSGAQQRGLIDEAVGNGRVHRSHGLTAGGRPHVVEEAIRDEEQTFVRGKVRHPDHRVLRLKDWHRVLANTEEVSLRPTGMTWID